MDKQKIEAEFVKMQRLYEKRQHQPNATSIECVLQYLYEHQDKVWWWAWEVIGKKTSDGKWLSHRAPARASDLYLHHPQLVESRKIGRFVVFRLRTENEKLIKQFLNIK